MVSSSTVPSMTANSVQVVSVSTALAELGHSVLLVGRNRTHEGLEVDPFCFYGVDEKFSIVKHPWRRPTVISALLYSLRASLTSLRFEPDLVISRNLLATWFLSLLGLKVVHESHAPENAQGLLAGFLFELVQTLPGFLGCLVISESLKRHYLDHFPRLHKKIWVARDGAFSSQLTVRQPEERGKLKVGYVGSIYEGRGIGQILDIARACQWADFQIVGNLTDAPESLRNKANRIANVSLRNFVRPSEVPTVLQDFDILLAPYQRFTKDRAGNDTTQWMSPLKIFEYMASGVPMIVSDLPALREFLRDGENCRFVSPLNSGEWVRALEEMRAQPEMRVRIAQTAKLELETKWSWEQRMKGVIGWLSPEVKS